MQAIGGRLGHYVISGPLGAGGMGEVYRARDTRLGRDVAIKVLPEEYGGDAQRLARFEREAKVLASLNHPNIATLYGLETAQEGAEPGPAFLVMELVEGEDLSQRVAVGPVPVRDAVQIARQVAEGLEAAHNSGVVHRDLKPGNIRITPDGMVKILDFGLAKDTGTAPGAAVLSGSPTVAADMTQAGTVLGTAPYLSPEQARGQVVDRRTDIWALGCVLFEMLTGRRAFPGSTATEILAQILERDPDWGALPSSVPPALEALLARCLEKEPKGRLRDAGDVALALEDLDLALRPPDRAAGPRSAPRTARVAPWLVAAAAAALAVVTWTTRPAPQPQPVLRFTQTSPVPLDLSRIGHFGPAVAVSPDGGVLVWVGAVDEGSMLFMRRLDQDEIRPVDGSEGGLAPFISPDGEWIGFFAAGKLQKAPVRGGVPQTICEVEHLHGASWGDGIIVVDPLGDGELFRIDPRDGEMQRLVISNQPGYRGGYPVLLPGSDAMLVSSQGGGTVDLVELDTLEVRNLVKEGTHGSYAPTGHLLWTHGDCLLAAPFDLSRREITGEAHTVVEGIISETHVGLTSHYAVSAAGTLVYLPGTVDLSGVRPVWVSLGGVVERLPLPAEPSYLSPRVSPDGRKLLFSRQAETRSLWIYDLDRGVPGTLSGDGGNQYWAIWTPDSAHVVFNSQQSGEPVNLWMQPVDRGSPAVRLTTAAEHHLPMDMTRDGRTVIFISKASLQASFDVMALHLGDEPTIEPLLVTDADECHPILSPDEHWLAYASDASGRMEVYVQPYPDLGSTLRVSPNGGTEPLWSPSGDRLYYRSDDGRRVYAVDVLGTDPLRFGKEKLLFGGSFFGTFKWARKWDIHPDGDRFLMLEVGSSEAVAGLRVVVNWFPELERLGPHRRLSPASTPPGANHVRVW